ncbi:TPA: hypothetical protein ACGRTY_005096 [Escherichia coli]|nr:hypothetical protein [Escherichia coli]HBB8296443.1 hypothetical protein [Escherichia coli]
MRGKFFMGFLMIFFIHGIAYSNDNTKNTVWIYHNVSDIDVFGKHDSLIISALDETYSKVVINMDGRKLTINDYSLENSLVCSTDYVEVKKKPLSYYLSQTTVGMYRKLFKHEGKLFPEEISIMDSVHKCPGPYRDILKINDQIIIPEKYYVLFFNEKKHTSEEKKEKWSTWCHDVNPRKEFDGSSKEHCYFEGFDLKGAYDKLLALSYEENNYLKEKLPIGNFSYKIDDKNITYQWIHGGLNISVIMENESMRYLFSEKPSGVNVEITNETQY